jgi:hypothetical protein
MTLIACLCVVLIAAVLLWDVCGGCDGDEE